MALVQGGGSTVSSTSRTIARKTRSTWHRVVSKLPTKTSQPPTRTSSTSSTRSVSSYGTSSVSRSTPSTYTTTQRTSARQRADTRQQARDEHRQYVENVRGRNAELRLRRARSLLNPVENSLLGSPFGIKEELPKFIGERWNRGTNQSISDSTWTAIQYGNSDVTAETVGYNQMYDSTTNLITIPSGLGGVWLVTVGVRWASNATGGRELRVRLNGATDIFDHRVAATSGNLSYAGSFHYVFDEGDYFEVDVQQNSTAALNLLGGRSYTYVSYQFMGKGGI